MWPEFSHKDEFDFSYLIERPLAHWDGDLNDYEYRQHEYEEEVK